MKIRLLLCATLWLTACGAVTDFPTEEEVRRELVPGMTPEQVIARYGTPGGATSPAGSRLRVFSYLSPVNRRMRDEEGYIGFKAFFENGRLLYWEPIVTRPSFDPDMRGRELFVPLAWYFALLILGAVGYGAFKALRFGADEYTRLLNAYADRDIPTSKLPPDFRFIDHDTTLQEVQERVGQATRTVPLTVPENFGGYGTVETDSGAAAIVILEYEMPYRAAVILMPEYPFEPTNRIRAAYFRPARPDED